MPPTRVGGSTQIEAAAIINLTGSNYLLALEVLSGIMLLHLIAGWSSPVARQAHNLKVLGSNPSPATNSKALTQAF